MYFTLTCYQDYLCSGILAWYQDLICSGFEEEVKNVKIQFRICSNFKGPQNGH
jgi:hypothetical protein